MADSLPDDIIRNILARLPTKILLRCRCVSTYWNRLLSDPSFLKLRSHRTIISLSETLLHIDDMAPNSIYKRSYPLQDLDLEDGCTTVIGTFNGIVLLAYSTGLILYNPFTGASNELPQAPVEHERNFSGYGFGYGATPNDLKIVSFGQFSGICNVYTFQDSSWSTLRYNANSLKVDNDVGTFLNGFLYWITYRRRDLTVLNLKDMELSMIHLPSQRGLPNLVLGTIDGCLCLLEHVTETRFDVWVMKKHDADNIWSIKCSFNLPLEGTLKTFYFPLSILDRGRFLLANTSRQPLIYDISNGSYTTFNFVLNRYIYFREIKGLEYVESVFSPSCMCSSLELKSSKRKRKT